MKGFIIKECYHIFRDRRSLLILFGMPIVQVLLFGFAITNEIKDVPIAVLDPARDEVSTHLVDKLIASGYFHVERYLQNEQQIERVFQQGRVKAVVVLPSQFDKDEARGEQTAVQVITDATEPNTANTVVSYATAIIADYQQGYDGAVTTPYQIKTAVRMYYNPALKGVFMFIPGTMTIILMLVSAMMTSISIAREKETGTMEILLVSPLSPFQVVVGKVFPYILLSSVNAVVIVCLGYFVFHMPIAGSLLWLSLVTWLFIITALSLGILISTVAKTQQTAMMISLVGLMLPTIMLSGFIFPISSMPWPLQWFSNIMPAKWFIIIVKGIMLKGVEIHYLWKEVGVLVGMTTVFIGLSIKNYAIRLE